MAAKELRRVEAEQGGSGSGPGAPIRRADDLKGFLQALSDQIAESDRRHSDALRDMRERLGKLGEQTGSVKAQLPREFEANIERLEDGAAHLTDQMEEAAPRRAEGHAAGDTIPPVKAAKPTQMEDLDEPVRAAQPPALRVSGAEQPPALRSAVPANATGNWARPTLPPAALMEPKDEEPWDTQSAEALTNLYASGEAALTRPGVVVEPESVAIVKAALAALPAAKAEPASAAPAADAKADAAPVAAPAFPDREWLETRLKDVAVRVEQSLAQLKPEGSLADFTQRFDQLEERWSHALVDVATRSDVEGLRLVEAHIAELATRLDEMRIQQSRLDAIETQLGEISRQLTDDQVVRLFGNLVPTEDDLSRFAEAAAEKVAARMSLQPAMAAAAPVTVDTRALEAAQSASGERINHLQAMLTSFIDERRRGEADTAEALETVQQALQHMLDRIEAMDAPRLAMPAAAVAQAAAAPASVRAAATAAAPAQGGQTAAPRSAAAVAAGADTLQAEFETHRAAAKAAAAAVAGRSSASQARAALNGEVDRNAELLLEAPRRMPDPPPSGPPGRTAPRPVPGAADRRPPVEVARKAPDRPKQAEPSADTGESKSKAAGLRDRLLGSGGDQDKAGVKPGLLLVPCVAALLVANYLLLAAPKNRTGIGLNTARMEQSLPRVPAGGEVPASASPASGPAIDTEETPAKSDPVEPADKPATPGKRGATNVRGETGDTLASRDTLEPREPEQARVAMGSNGIAVQVSKRIPSESELLQARERMHVAAFSQQTAMHAAEMAAVPPSAVPAALRAEDDVKPSATASEGGQTQVEMPPATVGPMSLRLAAAKGDRSAQFEVAARLAEGKGTKQDFQQAAVWYQRAAAQGLPVAQYRLAALYERGLGVKADPVRARVWYTRAAEQGNVRAMHNLAVLSAGRENGNADYPGAVQWFTEAAERGLADSQYNLGVLHESGLGVPKSLATAYKWYSLAARGGDREAARRRDLARSKLDAIALQSAEETVSSWRARPIESAANDAIVTGNAWRARASEGAGGG